MDIKRDNVIDLTCFLAQKIALLAMVAVTVSDRAESAKAIYSLTGSFREFAARLEILY